MVTQNKRKRRSLRKKKQRQKQLAIIFALIAITCVCLIAVVAAFVTQTKKPENGDVAQSETTTEAVTEPPTTKEQIVNIDLMMIGDMLVHEGVYKSGNDGEGNYNFDHLFENIADDIAAADMKIVNQETILGGVDMGLSAYPCFNSPQEIGDAEVAAGFNIILHATNHAIDKGLNGLLATTEFWNTKHPDIPYLGIHDSAESADKIYVYEKEGFKVAVLNYTYGTNGIPIPSSAPYCVDTFDDEEKVRNDIRRAKAMADMVIMCPHWGTEYVYEATDYQKYWTNVFLEEGVDLVLGTHPHVIEPVEEFTREDGSKMVVYYSLGNFVSNQDEMPRMIGGMAKVRLTKKNDEAYIDSYSFVPLVTHKQFGYKLITTYKLEDYTEELASTNAIRNDGNHCYTTYGTCYCGAHQMGLPTHGSSNFSLQYCKDFVKMVMGEDY